MLFPPKHLLEVGTFERFQRRRCDARKGVRAEVEEIEDVLFRVDADSARDSHDRAAGLAQPLRPCAAFVDALALKHFGKKG